MVAHQQPRPIGTFVMTPKSLLYDTRIGDQHLRLYQVIVDQIWEHGGTECTLPHVELARLVGAADRTLRRTLADLVDLGLLACRRTGQGQSKAYWPLTPDAPKASRPELTPLSLPVPSNRPKTASSATRVNWPEIPAQAAEIGQFNWPKTAATLYTGDRIPETPETGTVPTGPVSTPIQPPLLDASVPSAPPPPVVAAAAAGPSTDVPDPDAAPAVSKSSAPRAPLPDPVKAQVAEIWAYYRAKIQPDARVHVPQMVANRLKTFSLAEIKAGIDHFAADWWWMENNAGQGSKWFFGSDAQVERWVTMKPRPPKGSQPSDSRRFSASPPKGPYDGSRHGALPQSMQDQLAKSTRF